jgi:hypothetical protein
MPAARPAARIWIIDALYTFHASRSSLEVYRTVTAGKNAAWRSHWMRDAAIPIGANGTELLHSAALSGNLAQVPPFWAGNTVSR